MSEYKPRTLAGALLQGLGITPLEEIERMERVELGEATSTPKLDTVKQITEAIARTTQRMMAGQISAPDGRAQLYGLQTLLVAKRMEEEHAAGQVIEIPMLHAGGADELLHRLLDLARATSEDGEQ